ncbi:RNA polymerase sigma-70 factor, ECF subfamily [Paenibacillus catalpae]|uniref:RNA polymerase sigma-70 factor, ECF subfamily n=1 Tax=Paenibacillus catalpae TaxID=1045775 RepID=A0A1I1V4R4_9BACL|nr:RNA polymerase sigma factor [Paenibacillus catalpae]SFD78032.1 RNA polymerase sigma-70 factor, ECF subfamily [Paenibacillus catalpae]
MAKAAMEKENKELERLQGVVSRYCLSLTKSRVEAEDLAQEAWLKAMDSSQPLEHVNPDAYLLRIARNTWIDRVRRQSTHMRMLEAVRQSAKHHAMPDDSLIGTEIAMQAILTFLSPLQRAVFLMRDVSGYSAQETALRLGLTAGAVKAALHRARAALPSVRQAIEKGSLKAPKDEGLRDVLRALAIAYDSGDIEAMLTLVQHGELEPAPAIAVLQSRRLRAASTSIRRGKSTPSMGIAA